MTNDPEYINNRMKKQILFYKNVNKILVTTYDSQYVQWFRDVTKEYLGFEVDFVSLSEVGLSEISCEADDNRNDCIKEYAAVWQHPFILLLFSDGIEIIPVERIDDSGTLITFGTWVSGTMPGEANKEFVRESIEQWFFESISNKFFWQEITGEYEYPRMSEKYKAELIKLIKSVAE